jgi:hypothetical protein
LAPQEEPGDAGARRKAQIAPDLDSLTCFIVELNPLAEFAGSGLFDWVRDKPVLLGVKPFEFRVQESVPNFKFLRHQLTPSWRRFVEAPPTSSK